MNESEVIEFGEVKEDTHGGFLGHNWDGGFGWRLP